MTELTEILRKYRLGNSLFTAQHILSDDEIISSELSEEDIKEIIMRDMQRDMAAFLAAHFRDQIKASRARHFKGSQFELRLMVMSLPEFKQVVEDTIALLPEQKIQEIKNRKYETN